jgi:preprotein translocase subunit SecE
MTHAEVDYRGSKAMDVNKAKPNGAEASSFSLKNCADFVGEVKQEIMRIHWTSWEELKVYTQIVVGATFAFGIGLYLADLAFQSVLNSLGLLVRLISG